MIVCIAEKPSVARDIAGTRRSYKERGIYRRERIPGDLDIRASLYLERTA